MRRRFKSKIGVPLTKTTGEIARNRGFQKPSETNKTKRVRFDDAETDASSGGHEAAQSPRCGAAKTSEYAYFRKVKDGAVNGHFRELHKENEQLKSSKISFLHRESNKESEKLDPGIKDLCFSISRESAGPSAHKLSVLPPVSRYDEPNEIRRKEPTHKTKQRSSLLAETATPVEQCLFSSPLNQATEKSVTVAIDAEPTHKTKQRSFDLPRPENQCEKGYFSEKRKRLRQWVAHTTSSEVGKRHEKGLIPKGNENNDSSKENADKSSKPLTIYESDNVEKGLPLSHKSDCHKELPKISSERSSEIVLRECDRFDSGFPSNHHEESDLQETMDHYGRSSEIVLRKWGSFDSGFPSNYHEEGGDLPKTLDHCGRSSEIVLREWDSFNSGLPSNYHKEDDLQKPNSGLPSNYHKEDDLQKTMDPCGRSSEIVLMDRDSIQPGFPSNYHEESDLQNKTVDPDQHSNSRICNSSDTQHGYSFCLPFESFRSLGAFHFKDLDEFGPIVGHEREERYRNSLEWDFELGKDRVDHGTRQRIVDDVLDTKGFCPSPIFSSHCLFSPLPNYVSTSCLVHEVQPKFDDVKYAMVKPEQYSLSFPSSPKYIPLAEEKNAENALPSSDVLLSYRDRGWPKKVWDCTPHNDIWWKCSSAPDFSAEDYPSGFHSRQFSQNENGSYSPEESLTSFCEGAFDHYLFSSTLRSPLDTFLNCPLLLNHVSQDIHDVELYSDDYDNEMGYRNML